MKTTPQCAISLLGITAAFALPPAGTLGQPMITSQPVGAVVYVGSVATLSASISGTGVGYQWLKDGAILPGQTNNSITFDSFEFANSGRYQVVATNADGMSISLPATLSVPGAPLQAWGRNNYGQFGNGTTAGTNRPATMATNVVAVAAGYGHALFVKDDGTLWAAGYNRYGQLGNGTTNDSGFPAIIDSNVVAVAAGDYHSLFLKRDGTLWGTGANYYGGATTNRPVNVDSNVVAVVAGGNHSLFVKSDGTLWTAGVNNFGQLGNGDTASVVTPQCVASNVVAVAAGWAHSLFVRADGTLWGMGFNKYGNFGDGTTNNSSLPVNVASDVVAAAGGGRFSLLVKSDGTLWATGQNNYGQLGNGTTNNSSIPIKVGSKVVAVAAGDYYSLFVKSDGKLWVMGLNSNGQLGDGTYTQHNSPVQVSTFTVAGLDASYDYSLAVAGTFIPPVKPLIRDQPSSCTNLAGTTAAFTVAASGDQPLMYQWRKGGASLLNDGRISGVTTTNLVIANVQPSDAGDYTVVVTNFAGSATSLVAQLTIISPGRLNDVSYWPSLGFFFVFKDGTAGRPIGFKPARL